MTDARSNPAPDGAASPAGTQGRYMASTVKHGLIYFLGNVLSRLAGFVMLPVYTRILTTADYGILEILSLSADILGMLAGLGIRHAVLRLYYQYEAAADRNAVVSTASILLLGIFSAIMVVGLLFAKPISAALLGPDQSVLFVQLAIVSFAVGALGDVPGVWLQALQRSSHVVLANFSRLVLALSLNILFVVVLRTGVAGIFWSTIISAIVTGGVVAIIMFRETGARFVPSMVRELVAFGSPLVVSNLGSFVLHFSNRYFLRYYQSLAVVGVFALSYKFAMLLPMLVDGPFNAIWSAKALEIHRREGERAPPILRAILRQYNLLLVTVGLGIALFATDVIHFVLGADFRDADRAVPLLTIAMIFFCYRSISQTGAMIGKRPGYIAMVTSLAAAVALVLNVLLIPRYGAMGAAAATATAFGLEFFIMRVLSERAYAIGLGLWEMMLPLAIAGACWFAASLAVPDGAGPVAGLAVRMGALAAYALLLTATGVVPASARQMVFRSLRDPRAMMNALRSA